MALVNKTNNRTEKHAVFTVLTLGINQREVSGSLTIFVMILFKYNSCHNTLKEVNYPIKVPPLGYIQNLVTSVMAKPKIVSGTVKTLLVQVGAIHFYTLKNVPTSNPYDFYIFNSMLSVEF